MIRIGKIVATHGLQGSLVLTHIVGDSKWLKKDTTLFVEMQKGSFIPFFTASAKATNDEEYTISLEDVGYVDAAKRLVGRQVYVQEDVLANYADRSPLLWIGFTLVDKEKGNIGQIEDVMQTATQWLAKLTYQDTEVLIPLIEQTISQINLKTKIINITLPEGLLEVYLGEG